MITPVQYNTNFYPKKYNTSPQSFRGGCSLSSVGKIEKTSRKIEFMGRVIFNKIAGLFNKNKNKELYNEFLVTDTKSPEYIDVLSRVSRQYLGKKNLEVNFENNRITNLAKSGKPHIFIMNHDSQAKDPQMLAAFNTLLNDEYLALGLAKTCPRPRIILNEDILLSMNERNRNIFEKMGSVGIDASIHDADTKGNTKKFIKLMREFLKGEVNIFIFPEGKNSINKSRSLAEKFQLGVAEMVARLTGRVPEVNVTPLGFAYGKKSQVDGIHIGKTIKFRKEGDNIVSSVGNIGSEFASEGYKNFFKNRSEAILTEKGVPVKGKEQAEYIGGVLCENLRICKEEAKKSISNQ